MEALIVACTARALFDLEHGHSLFESEGVDAYAEFQRSNEDDILEPGIAFPVVQKLLALNRLWRLDWPRERLAELALRLGADVPFFLLGQPAYARGVGERLSPLDASAHPWLPRVVVLVAPPAHVPTAAVFGAPFLYSRLGRGRGPDVG